MLCRSYSLEAQMLRTCIIVASGWILLAASSAGAAPAYDDFAPGLGFDQSLSGYNSSGPGTVSSVPFLSGEQFVSQASGSLSEIRIAGGWYYPYVVDPSHPGFELTANLALVQMDGSIDPSHEISIPVPAASIASFQARQIVDLDLAGSGYLLQAGSRYDLWLVVTGANVFTWAFNSTGDVGPHLLSVDYAVPPTVQGSGTREAFRIDVPEAAGTGGLAALVALAIASLRRVRSSAPGGCGAPARPDSGSRAG
jgi:hypothetical protein